MSEVRKNDSDLKSKIQAILLNSSQKSVIGWAVEEDDFESVSEQIIKELLYATNYNKQHNLLTGLLKNLKVTDQEKTIQQIASEYLSKTNSIKYYYCLDENIKGSNYKCDKQCDSCSKRNA